MKLDVEPFLKQLMAVLLTLRAECSLVTSKSAHLSPYLPSAGRRQAVCLCGVAGYAIWLFTLRV